MSTFKLEELGLTQQFKTEAAQYGENLFLARVSAQHRDIYKVITQRGEIHAAVSGKFSYEAEGATEYPAVGDWVLVDRTDGDSGNAVIHRILKRKGCFERKAAGTGNEYQIIASNIDTVFICMALNNDYNLRRLERYLSIAWDSTATPVIVLTKADLCCDIAAKLREIEEVALGVDVILTTSMSGDGYEGIMKYLSKGKTVVFIGSSGVGKSTLINKLLGRDVLATKSLRNDDKGKHTTTHRQLFVLANGGIVIDTPGLREIQIAGADLSRSFTDITDLATTCRFRDCSHEQEPGCAVRNAVASGMLSASRFENYKKLQKELTFAERKETMTAAQAEKKKFIDMMGSLGAHKQIINGNMKYKKNWEE